MSIGIFQRKAWRFTLSDEERRFHTDHMQSWGYPMLMTTEGAQRRHKLWQQFNGALADYNRKQADRE